VTELYVHLTASDVPLVGHVARHHVTDTPEVRPRVVIDAPVAAADTRVATAAHHHGVTVLVDPQTHYLQGRQHPADPWAQLPYATEQELGAEQLLTSPDLARIVGSAIDLQITAGATAVIAPYVHIEAPDDGWVQTQLRLWDLTRDHLRRHDLRQPVLALVGLSWRLLDRPSWPGAVRPLQTGLRELAPQRIALAAGRVDQGTTVPQRLAALVHLIAQLRPVAPLIAWQQGQLGLATVAAGALGYQTGLGWRERCDLRRTRNDHRYPRKGPRGGRPVYLAALGRSVPPGQVNAMLTDATLRPQLICPDPECCPSGWPTRQTDHLAHTVSTRARQLATLTQIGPPQWRWGYVADQAAAAQQFAATVNRRRGRHLDLSHVDPTVAAALQLLAAQRRTATAPRRRRAA